MGQENTPREILSQVMRSIRCSQWEEESIEPQLLSFFQNSRIGRFYKIEAMCAMSKYNLKFSQLENVDSNNPQELHHQLMNLFGTNEENTLSMVHILACIVNNKSIDVIQNLIDTTSTRTGESILAVRLLYEGGPTILHIASRFEASIDVINKLIVIGGGKEFVNTTTSDGDTALYERCSTKTSMKVINKLIDVGGRDLVMTTNSDGRTALHEACCEDASVDMINKLIDVGGRELVMIVDNDGETALHKSIWGWNSSSLGNVIIRLIELGGRDLVMRTNNDGEPALCLASSASMNIINNLIDVGGRDLVMLADNDGDTILHRACHNTASIEKINKLIDIGGRELVMTRNRYLDTALHSTCDTKNPSIDIINKLIDVGGRDLVMARNTTGVTALHWACSKNLSINVINTLIDVGGRDLVMTSSNIYEHSVLDFACSNNASIDIIKRLTNIGGKEFLNTNILSGKSPLIALLSASSKTDNIIAKASFLISKGLQYKVAGEFGFGGLFDSCFDYEAKETMYREWAETIIPALEQEDMALMNRQSILLHAAIIAKAPVCIIRSIIIRFLDCITSKDSMGRYPIEVGVAVGLKWNDGMDDIVPAYTGATTEQQGQKARLMINVAALHGLHWENGMQQVAEESMNEVGNNDVDALTGLFPFMLAATGKWAEINSIFELMRRSPHNVKLFNCPRKRQSNQDIHHDMTRKKSRKAE